MTGRIAASRPDGVVLSADAGKTWVPLQKLPNHWFNECLAFAGSHLVAGTGGNGAFWIDVDRARRGQP